MKAEPGEVKFYQESRDVYKVFIVSARERTNGDFQGEEYLLRILEVLQTDRKIKPRLGSEFIARIEPRTSPTAWSFLEINCNNG